MSKLIKKNTETKKLTYLNSGKIKTNKDNKK